MHEDSVSVNEAADAFADMMDEQGDFLEEASKSSAEEAVAELIEEELEEEGGEDEDSEVESEDDTEEESEETDEESEDDQDDTPSVSDDTLVDIEIDGEAYEVNFHELKAGYLRNEEYVKRTTELESEYAQRMAELSQKEAELVKEIEATAIIATADLSRFEKTDWAKLKSEDPAKYAEQFSEYMEKRQAIQAQIARRNQVQELTRKAEQIKHEAYLQEQLTMARKLIPEFDDQGYRDRIFKYADSIGIPKEEVQGISDARHLLLLSQAMQFQESQVRKKTVVQKKVKDDKLPPVVKPQAKAPKDSSTTKRQKALEAQFAKTGTISDAARAFEAFI